MSRLQIEALDVRYGLLQAVKDVSFGVDPGDIVAFIGANGAGKTTLFRAIAGAHRPAAGHIVFAGEDVTSVPDYRRVRKGIALVPEGRHLFTDLTVAENLGLARAAGRKGRWDVQSVLSVFPNLAPHLRQKSGTLSGGEQQAAAIARALVANPEVLLLDEVSLGLSPVAVEWVYASIRQLVDTDTAILLVEQDLNRALSMATRVICMREGRVVARGAVNELTREDIMEAYFGAHDAPSTGASAQ